MATDYSWIAANGARVPNLMASYLKGQEARDAREMRGQQRNLLAAQLESAERTNKQASEVDQAKKLYGVLDVAMKQPTTESKRNALASLPQLFGAEFDEDDRREFGWLMGLDDQSFESTLPAFAQAVARQAGIKPGAGFTLGQGQTRFDDQGRPIASVDPAAREETLVEVHDPKSPTGFRYAPRSEASGQPSKGFKPGDGEGGAGGALKPADENAIFTQSAALFGGTFNPLSGRFSGLSRDTAQQTQAIAARASRLFVEGGMTRTEAVKSAARELGIEIRDLPAGQGGGAPGAGGAGGSMPIGDYLQQRYGPR